MLLLLLIEFIDINHEKFQYYKLLVEILTESLFAEILPVTESLSRQNFQKISIFLICCICFIRYYKLFFRFFRGKLIDFSLLKNQVKTFIDILVILNDGFHDGFFQKRIDISSTQRLLKVFKKQRENKKCEQLIFLFVIFSCNISYPQSKQITSSSSSSTRWSSSLFSDSCDSGDPIIDPCQQLTEQFE